MEKILIIGGVAAGATAAAKARRLSADAEITVLEAGPDISFANCGLPYYIGGDIKNRSSLILQSPESFKEQYNVQVYTHTLAESIDTSARRVQARHSLTGERLEFSYDKLILAQGGRPISPDLPGSRQDHVFSLWTLEDMDRIERFIQERGPKSAAIVGGGFIGLEMAEALVKRGLKVSVIEKMPHVLSLMDGEIAGFVQEEMLSYGVDLRTGVGLSEIMPSSVVLEDGTQSAAELVLLSIGVRPTLQLAKDAGLAIGPAGGLQVDAFMRTSDPFIYAAGDMVEIEHRVHKGKVRIPLAGPANRQGRIAAENALEGRRPYQGAMGTSVVRVFEAVAGITGLSLKAARAAGLDAEAITVHKEHHTSYYPGAHPVTVRLVYERHSGRILGAQTAGYAGAERRLDVLALAAHAGLTVHDIADVDFAYSPPLGTANDAVNMAAFVAQNRLSGYSPSLSAEELDAFVQKTQPIVIDLRDSFAFAKGHIAGANPVPLEFLGEVLAQLPPERMVLVYDETGKKGHQALRYLKGAGHAHTVNISGGFSSVRRHALALSYQEFDVELPAIEMKTLAGSSEEEVLDTLMAPLAAATGPIVVDVRTPGEFAGGAYPGAVNIPLDELPGRVEELGTKDRDITLYCASGARSGYAAQLLQRLGFTHVTNGGGLTHMLRRKG